jgi:hypothetical protein
MIIRPRRPSGRRLGKRSRMRSLASLCASVGGRPSRLDAPPTLALMLPTGPRTIPGPAARTPATRGGAGRH